MSTERHLTATDEICETASLYALGLLGQEEAAAFERHRKVCPVCDEEAREFARTGAQLAFALPVSAPGPELRRELLKRTGGDSPVPPFVLLRSNEGGWTESGFAGVTLRQMYTDAATGAVTSLVRMTPGAVYPGHRHAGVEHCYVLEGDLVFEDHTLHAGDYEVAPASTDHSFVTTSQGCLLLIINNLNDHLLPA
jgi:anti-sigma factor ChrR (cupin superfamily)